MKHTLETFTIRALLEQSALRYPQRLALSLYKEKERYTYGELRESVDRVATYLLRRGVQEGERIALLAESSPMWGVSYLAIVSAGAVAVPILPEFSTNEVEHIVQHSEADRMFISSSQCAKLPLQFRGDDAEVYRVDDLFHVPSLGGTDVLDKETFGDLPAKNMRRRKADDTALAQIAHSEDGLVSIIYTSGTTGNPKGVMLSNRNLTSNAVASSRQFFKVKTGMKFLSILP